MRALSYVVGGALLLISSLMMAGPASAQVTEADVTLHPGDTIVWTTPNPHGLRFGGTTEVDSAIVQLPHWNVVQTLLKFPEEPEPETVVPDTGEALFELGGTDIKVIVADDADKAVDPSLIFTCANSLHPNAMTSVKFKITPAEAGVAPREFKIRATGGPLRWVLTLPSGQEVDISPPSQLTAN